MSPRRSPSLIGAALCLCLVGCGPESSGTVGVSFVGFALTGPMADPGTPMTDETGLVALDRFPAFLTVRVVADDLDSPVEARWPEVVPEAMPEAVDLELEVAAGDDRAIEVELFLVGEDGRTVATYLSPQPGAQPELVEVAAGQQTTAEINPVELERGTVRAELVGAGESAWVSWIDQEAAVVLPAVEVVDGLAESELSIDRTYWPRVIDGDGEAVDLEGQTLSLSQPGEFRNVTLDLSL